MKTRIALLLVLFLVVILSGCTQTTGAGNLVLYVSDQPGAIDDFDSVIVTIEKVRIFGPAEESEGNNTYIEAAVNATLDLKEVTGDRVFEILDTELATGRYTKIELYVADVEAAKDLEPVDVVVPSSKLMMTKNIDIEDSRTTEFVFDINVVLKGATEGYNLVPVITESGTVGKEIAEDEIIPVGKSQVTPAGSAHFVLYVSDEPVDITDFDSVIVTFDKARIFGPRDFEDEIDEADNETETEENETDDSGTGYIEIDVEGSADLTQLTGDKIFEILDTELEVGKYTKIELYVSDVEAQMNSSEANVTVPSGKLMITRNFNIVEGGTTEFVFDIHIAELGTGEYNLKPTISDSGVVGKDVSAEKLEKMCEKASGEGALERCE